MRAFYLAFFVAFSFAFSFALMQKKQKIKDNPKPPAVCPANATTALQVYLVGSLRYVKEIKNQRVLRLHRNLSEAVIQDLEGFDECGEKDLYMCRSMRTV